MAAQKFMQQSRTNTEALKWLQDAGQLQDDAETPAWVQSMREVGKQVFSQTGLPTLKWEDWKYTNLRKFAKEDFRYSAKPITFDASALPKPLIESAYHLTVVNGQYQAALSNVPKGVELLGLDAEGIDQYLVTVGDLANEPFTALNSAYFKEALIMKVPKGVVVDKPVEVLFYTKGDDIMVHPRVLYWLEEGAEATIIERHTGEGKYFSNVYEASVLEKNAKLKLYRFEEESAEAYHISSSLVQQHRDSKLELFSYAEGGQLAREEYKSEIVDQNVESNINGVYLVRGKQVHDFKILTSHFEPHGNSTQYFRGAVDDTAHATFQGKIYVHKGAQKTDGAQMNKALLLSKNAHTNFKPELEIYADDVKCAHGATSGQIDENALFYMRNRGLSKQEAEKLLVKAFLNEAVEKVSEFYMQEIIRGKIEAWLMQ